MDSDPLSLRILRDVFGSDFVQSVNVKSVEEPSSFFGGSHANGSAGIKRPVPTAPAADNHGRSGSVSGVKNHHASLSPGTHEGVKPSKAPKISGQENIHDIRPFEHSTRLCS